MFSNELDKLLILHIADLDEAARRVELLQRSIGNDIDALIRIWSRDNEWRPSEGTWIEKKDASVMPSKWSKDADANWPGHFSLWYRSGDDGEWSEENDYFWLTRLCAEGRGQMVFRFYQDEFKKTPWKKLLQERASVLTADTRFLLDDEPSVFLPVRIEKEALAKGAEEEDFSEALKPITEALDHIRDNLHLFEDLRAEMKRRSAVA